jgi:uncharacterized protein (TIGR02145 family)
MQKTFWIYLVALITLSAINTGCKKETLPSVSTKSVVIGDTTITTGGTITDDGNASITDCGVCWSTSANPTTADSKISNGAGTGIFTSVITEFEDNTTYHVRAYATNSVGTAYGEDIEFTTYMVVPKLTTNVISLITSSAASSGGSIKSDGGSSITAFGVCWNLRGMPTIDDNKTVDTDISDQNFTSHINGLDGFKTYYVRAYATNSKGTGYGNLIKFRTLTDLTITDYDGNQYNTVTIGTQVWMAENLKTTHYPNGDRIIYASAKDTMLVKLKTGAYNYYDDDSLKYKNTYGALYNWYAITDSRQLCPVGWHVPNGTEWNALLSFLGGADVAGAKMRETGTLYWESPNTYADNSNGFTALPGGVGYAPVLDNHRYQGIGLDAEFSSSSLEHATILLSNNEKKAILSNQSKSSTVSVRCLQD